MQAFASQMWVERCESLRRAEWRSEPLHEAIRRAYYTRCGEWNAARYVVNYDRDSQYNLVRQGLIVWC